MTIRDAAQAGQSEPMTSGDGRALAAEIGHVVAEFDTKAAHRQTQLYRFILLALALATTVISIIAAVT